MKKIAFAIIALTGLALAATGCSPTVPAPDRTLTATPTPAPLKSKAPVAVAAAPKTPAAPPAAAPAGPSPVPVIMYHGVSAGENAAQYKIPISLFDRQLQWLADNGYTAILSPQYADFLQGKGTLPPRPVIITFDDWAAGQYDLAVPALRKHGMKAIFFVNLNAVNGDRDRQRLKDLAAEGFEIGSHTLHHYYLTQGNCNAKWKCCSGRDCTAADIESEVVQSKAELEKILGRPVVSFAWPGNYFNAAATAVAEKAGYRAIYAVEYQGYEEKQMVKLPGITTSPAVIFRTEIDGVCGLEIFPNAVSTQRCCITSTKAPDKYCLPQQPAGARVPSARELPDHPAGG